MYNVSKLDILIPLHYDVGCYNLYFDNKCISEEICDPIELITDISHEHDDWMWDFSNAVISLYTHIDYVNNEYVAMNPDMVSNKKVCIYRDTFANILNNYDFNLPVPQHCMRLFMLYINSCKYLATLQQNNFLTSD